jgi:hypothetical protein
MEGVSFTVVKEYINGTIRGRTQRLIREEMICVKKNK